MSSTNIIRDVYTFGAGKYQITLELDGGNNAISVKSLETLMEYKMRDGSLSTTNAILNAVMFGPAALHEFVGHAFKNKSNYTYCFNNDRMIIGIEMPPYAHHCDGLTICLYPTPSEKRLVVDVKGPTNIIEYYDTFLKSLIKILRPAADDQYLLILFANETFDQAKLLHANAALYDSNAHYEAEIKICMKMIPVRCMYAKPRASTLFNLEAVKCNCALPVCNGKIGVTYCNFDCLWAYISAQY
jgi:hypothetical protein